MAGFVTRRHTRGIESCLQGEEVGVCQRPSPPFPYRLSPAEVRAQGDTGWGLGHGGRQAETRLQPGSATPRSAGEQRCEHLCERVHVLLCTCMRLCT